MSLNAQISHLFFVQNTIVNFSLTFTFPSSFFQSFRSILPKKPQINQNYIKRVNILQLFPFFERPILSLRWQLHVGFNISSRSPQSIRDLAPRVHPPRRCEHIDRFITSLFFVNIVGVTPSIHQAVGSHYFY